MRSHSVTCHPAGWYSIYLPRRDGRLSWSRWLVTHRDGLPARRQLPMHPSTNRTQCQLTTFIKTNALTTTLAIRHRLQWIIHLQAQRQGVYKFNQANFQEIPEGILRKIQDMFALFRLLCNVPNLLLYNGACDDELQVWYAFYTTWRRSKDKIGRPVS